MNYRSLGNGINGAVECIDTLANILALTLGTSVTQTTVPVGSKARPTDVAGCTLEMGADGLWTGNLGTLTQAQADALVALGVMAKVKVGTPAEIDGKHARWTGTAWQSDLIVGPFADLATANAWAAANPSSLFNGLLATAGGAQVTWSGSAWVGASSDGVMENIEPTKISMNRLPRGATFGDSTADCGGPSGTNGISDIEYCITSAGVQSNGNITVKGCPLFTKRRFNLVANCGRVGETTTQMLARSSIAYSNIRKSIEDVIAKKPDFVMFHGGSINDITSFDSSTPSASFSDVSNRHIKIVKRFLNAGVPVIDTGIYGYDGKGGVEATKLAAIRAGIVQINSEISAEASKYKQWMFVSSEGVVSTSGAYIAGMTDDGTHLSTSGANAIGAAMATEYDKLFVCLGTSAEQFTTVYSGATWANGTQPTDSPYVGPTGINVGTQTCTPQLWSIPFDVTAATNELLVLWTSIKALLGVVAGDSLMLQIMVTVKKDGSLFPANISTRCWIYDTVSHLNAIQHLYASNAYVDQQFYATVAQASMGANTRIGIALNNLPIGAGYSLELTPMVIVKRVQSSPMLI